MNIIFILPREFRKGHYVTTFTTEIVKFLSRKHRLAVVNSSGKRVTNLFPESRQKKGAGVKLADFDIICVQDVFGLKFASRAFRRNQLPVVFISHANVWEAQPFLCRSLLKVLSLSNDREVLRLPQELVQYFRKPVFTNGQKSKKRRDVTFGASSPFVKAVHFYQHSDADLSVVKTILKTVNSILDIQLTVVVPGEIGSTLKTLANGNVFIVNKNKFDEGDLVNFDLAITSDYLALKTIYMGVPTLIVGNRGLGGFVSSHNIHDHLNWHFDGRLGGEINEGIPITLMSAALKNFRKGFSEISHETGKASIVLRESLDARKVFRLMEKEITTAFRLYKLVLSDKYHLLKPRRIKEVKTVHGTQSNMYIVHENNKIVGSISEEANSVFENCQGKKTLLQLAAHGNLDVDGLGAFMKELWYEKIVVFEK